MSEYVTVHGGRTQFQDPDVWGTSMASGWDGLNSSRWRKKCITYKKDKLAIWLPSSSVPKLTNMGAAQHPGENNFPLFL